VSFTFGFPDPNVIRALRRAGSRVLVTVTTPAEAARGQEAGADGLVVQGWDAGGHSGTTDPNLLPEPIPLPDVVRRVRAVTSLPLVAAGGVATAEQARDALAAGAEAVAVGTALLRTDESGASDVHRAALADSRRTGTVVTRAFTGRPARALRNEFIDRYGELAPTGYPEVHHLTRPLRAAAAAAGEPELVHLWAGTGYRHARTGPAGDVMAELARLL